METTLVTFGTNTFDSLVISGTEQFQLSCQTIYKWEDDLFHKSSRQSAQLLLEGKELRICSGQSSEILIVDHC
jgi:hypothetical protein